MLFDDVFLKPGISLSRIAKSYGYADWQWRKIWDDPRNATLVAKRKKPEKLLAGDKIYVPIPWRITSSTMAEIPHQKGHFEIRAKRSGKLGENVKWLQTVFGDNQPQFPPSSYSVDLPTDDNDPFYWTAAEEKAHPDYLTEFYDAPFRNPPKDRTTTWRAVLSIGVITEKRVSILDAIVWGVNFKKDGTNSFYKPRPATDLEISGHILLLKNGKGKTSTFKAAGWTFRRALK
ncbi:MAG: hypothetical protein ABI169_18525 [Chitinophagaceae bacterium]